MPVVSAPHQAKVEDRRDHQIGQIDTGHRHAAIDHPRISQRSERQEQEAQDQNQEAIVKDAIQVGGEEKKQRQRDAGER